MAGVSGGVAATVLLHPLDLLKIRFAVNDGQNAAGRPTYAGMKNAVANIGTVKKKLRFYYCTPLKLGSNNRKERYFAEIKKHTRSREVRKLEKNSQFSTWYSFIRL